MTQLQFGKGAFQRDYSGSPENQLLNRFLEAVPSDERPGETVGLLPRQVTTKLAVIGAGPIRKQFSKLGLFNGDLFVVSKNALWRYSAAGVLTYIAGVIGVGNPKLTWDSGPGYQHLFIADGELLQVYLGGTHASGTLSGSTPTNQVIHIGGAYYSWNAAVNTGPPDGTAAHPFLANPTSGGDPFTAMANLLNFIGVPGTDFSSTVGGQNTQVTALANGGPPATSITLTAISENTDGNAIATTIYSGAGLSFGSPTLTGGGTHTLLGVYVPTGEPINALCTLDHYVMASVGGTNKMFFILPGAIVIQTLDFFSKESNPDPIMDLCTIGDNFLAAGSGSVETWYATGNLNAPFAPIQGRTIGRGIIDGTLVNVHDTAFFVGSDGVVYAFGGNSFERVSDNGIEERIRVLTRATAGVT
jgi:hypothetical protein